MSTTRRRVLKTVMTVAAGIGSGLMSPVQATTIKPTSELHALVYLWWRETRKSWRHNKDFLSKRGKYRSNSNPIAREHYGDFRDHRLDCMVFNLDGNDYVTSNVIKYQEVLDRRNQVTYRGMLDLAILFHEMGGVPAALEERHKNKVRQYLNTLMRFGFFHGAKQFKLGAGPSKPKVMLSLYRDRDIVEGHGDLIGDIKNIFGANGLDVHVQGDLLYWDRFAAHGDPEVFVRQARNVDSAWAYNWADEAQIQRLSSETAQGARDIVTFHQHVAAQYGNFELFCLERGILLAPDGSVKIQRTVVPGYRDTEIKERGERRTYLETTRDPETGEPQFYGNTKTNMISALRDNPRNLDSEGTGIVTVVSFNEWRERSSAEATGPTNDAEGNVNLDKYGTPLPANAHLLAIRDASREATSRRVASLESEAGR